MIKLAALSYNTAGISGYRWETKLREDSDTGVCSIITHRLHQTVSTAFVYEALVDRWHPQAAEVSRLTGVPPRTPSCREAGRAVAPQWLAGAGGFVHQHHRGVDKLAPASCGFANHWTRSGASCVHPGGG